LEDADFTNRVNKLRHIVLIEDGAGLFAVRMDVRDWDFSEPDTWHLDELYVVAGNVSGLCLAPGGSIPGGSNNIGGHSGGG
jgi:hypothetical protein